MGSDGSKERKHHEHLPKVPKYEEPNDIPLAGLGGGPDLGVGREGHSAGGYRRKAPGRLGSWFLRRLGLKPNEPLH